MAIINKTGITNGSTIQAEHVTRAIDALSGGSTDTVVATGSFSGSFKGDGSLLSGLSAGFPFTGSATITGSLSVTGSFRQLVTGTGMVIDSDSNGILTMRHNNINVSSSTVSFDPNASLNLSNVFKNGGLQIPVNSPGASATTGSMYFDIPNTTLYIYDGTQWTYIQLTP